MSLEEIAMSNLERKLKQYSAQQTTYGSSKPSYFNNTSQFCIAGSPPQI